LIGEFKMSTNIDLIDSDGPGIEQSLILQFLIKRFEEILLGKDSRVPPVIHALALAGLGTDEEVLTQYKTIFSWPYTAHPEIIQQAIEIFQTALQRDPDSRSLQFSSQEAEESSELNFPFCKLVARTALREGREMILARDYRFVQVFIILGWIGLQRDPERLAEFEEIVTSHSDDPERLVQKGRDILCDAVFLRRPPGDSSVINPAPN
jgi:hypothetical protein